MINRNKNSYHIQIYEFITLYWIFILLCNIILLEIDRALFDVLLFYMIWAGENHGKNQKKPKLVSI